MQITTEISYSDLAANFSDDLKSDDNYERFAVFLTELDNYVADWEFTAVVRDWVKKQKKYAKKEGIEF